MPITKRLTQRESLIVEYYTDIKSETRNNWGKSYIKAGYSKCHGWQSNACRIHNKDHIKAAIKAETSKIQENISVSRGYCIQKLLDIAESSTNERSVISAITVIGDFAGYHREAAPNPEAEAAWKQRLDEETQALREQAKERIRIISIKDAG